MQRRKFIKNTLSGLPLVFLTPSLFSSCDSGKNFQTHKTVIVVGAGISGLAAAKKLKEEGFIVNILESQNQVGGRLRTNRSLGVPFDEGASWIHGADGNPLTGLAQEAGMETVFTDDDSFVAYDLGGIAIEESAYEKTEKEYYEILENLHTHGSLNRSFDSVFNDIYPQYTNDRLWKFILSSFMTFDSGDLDNLSSLYYNEGEEFGGQERISTNGFDLIPNYLAKGLSILFNQRVTKINYSGAKIEVTHNGQVSEADFVIVTVPLGVLKKSIIEFIPALPSYKLNAIQKIGMNCVNKFLLTWETKFWDNEQYIAFTPEVIDKFNYFVNVNKFHPNVNALMTFAYAEYGRKTEKMSDVEIIDEIMTHLKDIYGNNIPNPTQMIRTKWDSNENSFGAYSYTAVGTEMRHFEDMAQEINSKLFFAGEHTHIDYFSNAHGAYLSGIREADKIIQL